MAESIRVQMSIETQEKLKLLAEEYNCFYNKKPSLSMLFAKIGTEEFTIQPKKSTNKLVDSNSEDINLNSDLLILKMNYPPNINGIIHIITGTIANNFGNIFRISIKEEIGKNVKERIDNLGFLKIDNLGFLKIHLSIEKHEQKNLSKLLNKIHRIKLAEIEEFNNNKDFIDAGHLLANLPESNKSTETEEEIDLMEKYRQQEMIINMSCIFGIEIIAGNTKNLLQHITKKIAMSKISVLSVIQNYNKFKKENVIKLFLEIKIPKNPSSKIDNEIGKIRDIIDYFQSGKQVMIFAFSLLIQRGIFRLASLLLQEDPNIDDYNIVKIRRLSIDDLDILKNSALKNQDISF